MTERNITVVYKWIANPGALDALKSIYDQVTQAMKDNEPGATEVQVHVSEEENALYVRDEFTGPDALGFHLSKTAAAHFPELLKVATPGPFYFFGDVPAEIQQATRNMGLASEFGAHTTGFVR